VLHLPTDFTGRELHGVDVRVGGVGANSREKRVEIAGRYVSITIIIEYERQPSFGGSSLSLPY
jgi:hypothetical protein